MPASFAPTAIGSDFHCPVLDDTSSRYDTTTGEVKSTGAVTAIVCFSPSYVAEVENAAPSTAIVAFTTLILPG